MGISRSRSVPARRAALAVLAAAALAAAPGAEERNGKNPAAAEDGILSVDCGRTDDGYAVAEVKPEEGKKGGEEEDRYKILVTRGTETLAYDVLRGEDGNLLETVIPLQMGSGTYGFVLKKRAPGGNYEREGSVEVTADPDPEAPFLHPNQYVDYDEKSEMTEKARELEKEEDAGTVAAIGEWIEDNVSYDWEKAASVGRGELPDPDAAFREGKGICQDVAALAACMARADGVPAKLVIGNADGHCHAWNEFFVDGEWTREDLTSELTGTEAEEYEPERVY